MPTPLTSARRIVVKVGSALLVDAKTGRLRRSWLKTLIEDLMRLRRRGQQVLLVSSGAIALGRRHLGLSSGTLRLEESQAAAAVGQIRLAHAYKELLEEGNVTVAQILLTLEDSEQRTRYLNARATLEALLSLDALPVINENDTVATAEIRYGDNDRLAARVAQMASADCLILLSDVDGLYTADPNRDHAAHFIGQVLRITPEIEAMAGRSCQLGGQVRAAWRPRSPRRASRWMPAAICALPPGTSATRRSGASRRGRARPGSCQLRLRSRPASNGLPVRSGRRVAIHIDAGALPERCAAARSLLPAGVIGTLGRFESGDTVSVLAVNGAEVARGIAAYSDSDAARIMGRKSSEIQAVLGFRGREELIHRDDLVILQHDLESAASEAPQSARGGGEVIRVGR